MNESNIHHIFYLQVTSELSMAYFEMAEYFKKINIVLVPIEPENLSKLDREKKHHLIYFRNNLETGEKFDFIRKSYLESGLLSGKYFLYDLSSFSIMSGSEKFDKKNCYHFISLPDNIKSIVMKIGLTYFNEVNSREAWPGGKRAKLPSLNTNN